MDKGTAGAGIRWVIIALTIGFSLAALTDVFLAVKGWQPISIRSQAWAKRYPFYAGVLVFVFGALLAHFFINVDTP